MDNKKREERNPDLDIILNKINENNRATVSPIKFVLPGKIWYPDGNKEVKVFPMTGAQQKKLASSVVTIIDSDKDSRTYGQEILAADILLKAIDDILNDNVSFIDASNTGNIVDKLYLQDYLALFFLTHFISYGDKYFSMNVVCMNKDCKLKEYSAPISSDIINVNYAEAEDGDRKFTLLDSGLEIELRPLPAKYIYYYLAANSPYSSPIISAVKTIDGKEFSLKDKEAIISTLYLKDSAMLASKLDKILNYGLDTKVMTVCPSCGTKNTRVLKLNSQGVTHLLPFRYD